MSTVSINDILGAPNLCGIIQSTVSGIPNPFPEPFFKVDQTVDGDTGEYKVFSGSRSNATISPTAHPPKIASSARSVSNPSSSCTASRTSSFP